MFWNQGNTAYLNDFFVMMNEGVAGAPVGGSNDFIFTDAATRATSNNYVFTDAATRDTSNNYVFTDTPTR